MGWGLFAGTALGLLQIACLPLVRCFSPLPEVRAAARTPAFLSALAQPVNGVAFVAEGVLLGLGAFRFLAAQTAVGAGAMMAFLSRAKTLSQVIYAIYWFNGIQAVLALFHHIRLVAAREAHAGVAIRLRGRVRRRRAAGLVCVVDDEE